MEEASDRSQTRAEEAILIWGSESAPTAESELLQYSALVVAPGDVESLRAMVSYRFSESHMETPERVSHAIKAMHERLWVAKHCRWRLAPPRVCSNAEMAMTHTPEFVAAFVQMEASPAGQVDTARFPNLAGLDPASRAAVCHASRIAAGAVLSVVDTVLHHVSPSPQPMPTLSAENASTLRAGLAVVRPPGHHSGRATTGPNCMLNSVAIAAKAAAAAGLRVLVVDWDIHYSGGTCEIVRGGQALSDPVAPLSAADEQVLLVDIYGALGGSVRDMARRQGRPWTVHERVGNAVLINVALLDSAAGDAVFLSDAVAGEVVRCIATHAPSLVLVSAGFDACAGDQEGFSVTPGGFGSLTQVICQAMVGRGAVVVVLEGGYVPSAVADSVCAVAEALLHATGELRV